MLTISFKPTILSLEDRFCLSGPGDSNIPLPPPPPPPPPSPPVAVIFPKNMHGAGAHAPGGGFGKG